MGNYATDERRTMKVLVVEDDKTLRTALGSMLERTGRAVLNASNVEEGLLHAPDADVILLDLKLGADSGERFLECLRGVGNYTPVIVLSGVYPKESTADKLKKYEIVDFMEKPFKSSELVDKLTAAEKLTRGMASISEAADKFVKTTQNLRQLAGKSITEIGRP